MSNFKRAVRSKVWLKIGIMGPSGSGKTYSSLLLAKGLAGTDGKIAALDTENGSLSLYADLAEVDVMDLPPPFEPKKAIAAINEAVEAGYRVLVIDSQTHFWKWILEYKENLDRQGGNSFTNWGKAKPFYESFKAAILQSPIHIICCMRAKDEYVLEKNDRGKDSPKKVGMGAIAEPGAEYEYTTVFEVGMDHSATASKDRTSMFDGEFFKITPATGQRFLDWLDAGHGEMKAAAPDPEPEPDVDPDAAPKSWERVGGTQLEWLTLADTQDDRKAMFKEAVQADCKTAADILTYAQDGTLPQTQSA